MAPMTPPLAERLAEPWDVGGREIHIARKSSVCVQGFVARNRGRGRAVITVKLIMLVFRLRELTFAKRGEMGVTRAKRGARQRHKGRPVLTSSTASSRLAKQRNAAACRLLLRPRKSTGQLTARRRRGACHLPTPPARIARATAQGAPRPDRSALVAASWRLRSQHTGATRVSRGLLPAAYPSPAS